MKSLRQRLLSVRNRLPNERVSSSARPTPEAIAALRSLGYLSGGAAPLRSSRNRPDPKDRIVDYEGYGRAITLSPRANFKKQIESLLR